MTIKHELPEKLSGKTCNWQGQAGSKDKTQITPPKRAIQPSDKTQFIKSKAPPDNQVRATVTNKKSRQNNPIRTPQNNNVRQGQYGTLKDRFILQSVVGTGGMGVVFKATDKLKVGTKDPYVAIKVLSKEFKTHPNAVAVLRDEATKSQKIAHPNIVTVRDFDRDGNTVFMMMEFLDGKPLDEIIRQHGGAGLPKSDVENILSDICSALIYAHKKGTIHSDFKPGNIFITKEGVAKVFDFGIAREVGKTDKLDDKTVDKKIGDLGALTKAYASVEMFAWQKPDVRDDIYALGCIAYEIYTGRHPFNRIGADEAKKQNLKPKKISGIRRNQWLAIEKALAFDRDDRIATVNEFWSLFNKKSSPVVIFF